jgi:hypothetical protein
MAENMAKWGRRTARERYGAPKNPDMKAEDTSAPQKLGDKNNLRGPDWEDDHPNDWVRGKGESAEGKPDFKRSQGYK